MTGYNMRMTCVSLCTLLIAGCGSSSSLTDSVNSALTQAVADEAAALLGGKGDAVWIQIPDAPFVLEDAAAEDADIKKALARRGIRVVAEEDLPYDPGIESTGEPFDMEALVDVLSRHPEIDLVISRVGLPRLTRRMAERLPEPRPRLMVVTRYQIPYLDQLPPGIPDVAILPRRAAADASADATPFDALYEIVRRAENRTSRPQP